MTPDLCAMVYASGLLAVITALYAWSLDRAGRRYEAAIQRKEELHAAERKAWSEERAALVERCTGAAIVTRQRAKALEQVREPVDARLDP